MARRHTETAARSVCQAKDGLGSVCEHSEIERIGVVEDLGVDGVDGDSLGSVVGIEAVGEGELGGVGMDGEEKEKEGEEREHGECQTSTNTQSILSLLRHPHSYKSHKCTTFTHQFTAYAFPFNSPSSCLTGSRILPISRE